MRRGLLALALTALALPAVARAQSLADYDYTNLAFRGAGLTLGYIWPTNVNATPVYGLRLDLGYLGPGIRIAPSISYWRSDMRESELDKLATRINALPALQHAGVTLQGSDLGPVRRSDLALDVDGEWVVTTPSHVLAYAGVGLGLHALRGSGSSIQNTFVQDLLDTIVPAVTGLAGLEFPLADRFRVFGELRFTGMADVQYAGLRLGGAFVIPGRNPTPTGTSGGRP